MQSVQSGFSFEFLLVPFELDTQSETQEIWTSCKLRLKGRFLEANLACWKLWADSANWGFSLPKSLNSISSGKWRFLLASVEFSESLQEDPRFADRLLATSRWYTFLYVKLQGRVPQIAREVTQPSSYITSLLWIKIKGNCLFGQLELKLNMLPILPG
jgi:hypothetical protein